MSAAPDLAALFERARDADLESVAGVRLFRVGQRLRGECPVCGASKGKRAGGAFWWSPQHRRWGCFAGGGECAQGGDVVRLEQLLRGGSAREAAERLAGPAAPLPGRALAASAVRPDARCDAPEPVRAPAAARGRPSMAARLADEGRRALGTLAERYFAARGIDERLARQALSQLVFNPRAFWGYPDEGAAAVFAPALVARLTTADGPTGGVHATYLAADGRGKARLDPAKRMWGEQKRGGVPGCAWLIGPDGEGPLIVAEGIESALSAAQIYGQRCRVAAALSLGALQGGWLADTFGRYSVEAPQSDPERPAFTWPDAGEVLIAIDRDMAPVRVKVRGPGGRTVRQVLDGEARARVCGALAVQAWRRAGAESVRVIAPPPGLDFNDWLKGRAA